MSKALKTVRDARKEMPPEIWACRAEWGVPFWLEKPFKSKTTKGQKYIRADLVKEMEDGE